MNQYDLSCEKHIEYLKSKCNDLNFISTLRSRQNYSFLDFLNFYSNEMLQFIVNLADFKSLSAFSNYIGVSLSTVKGWFSSSKTRNRIPTFHTWKNILCSLEARRLGFSDLVELCRNSTRKTNS